MKTIPLPDTPEEAMLKALGIACSLVVTSCQSHQEVQRKERRVECHTMYRTQQIDGLSIFYREAGPKDAPTLLLLRGLPSSAGHAQSRAAEVFDGHN